jgi:DNA (cytosine-5)-methyltransferase 1
LKKLKVIELFAGIGAWSKALENLGVDHEVVFIAEKEQPQVIAYNAIHNASFEPVDITTINPNDVPDCDIIFYSPPCQAFSAAGKQLGFEDQRGVLFFDALKIIKAKKPKYALMENVKGLTQKKFQFEFETMLELLEQEGYVNYLPNGKVINAKDYIPQNRERVFIVSIRKDIEQEFKFPSNIKLTSRLEDYLEPDAQLPILHNIYGGFNETEPRVFNEYSPTIRTSAGDRHLPSVVVKGCSLRTRSYMGQPQQLEVRKDNVSNTVTTVPKDFMVAINGIEYNQDTLPKKYKVVGEWLTRQMSTLEAWRLMGFSDEDHNKAKEALNNQLHKGKDKSKKKLYDMAGNSIVVNVVEEILKELLIHSEVESINI